MNDDNNNSGLTLSDDPQDMIKAALARAIASAPDIAPGQAMSASSDFPKRPGVFGRSTW
jgi:hypothetical protein